MLTRKRTALQSAARDMNFEMDGVTYTLHYGFDAIAAFEEAFGVNPATTKVAPTLLNLATLLYVGLLHYPDMKLNTVQGWFNQDTADELCATAWYAFYGALPVPEKSEETSPENPPNA